METGYDISEHRYRKFVKKYFWFLTKFVEGKYCKMIRKFDGNKLKIKI